MPEPQLHIANKIPEINIDGQYLMIDFIQKLTIFFKLNTTENEMLKESFYEVPYVRDILAPRNLKGDGIRFNALKNWVRHYIVGQGDEPPLPA